VLKDANSDGHVRAWVKDNRENGRCASVHDRYTAETKLSGDRTNAQVDTVCESEMDKRAASARQFCFAARKCIFNRAVGVIRRIFAP
jgi:hypothetical protein